MVFSDFEDVRAQGAHYNIIYADPPWSYSNKGVNGSADHHYQTMRQQDLKALPVEQIAADNSVLFLWVTFPMLVEGIELMRMWGFQYKTAGFVWVKENRKTPGWHFGTGFWTRANAEICLLGVRGKPKRQSARVRQLIVTPVEKHSKKPSEARERIVELMGDLPRIELFAREEYLGWDAWGNEVITC